jgi:hypothetical protein
MRSVLRLDPQNTYAMADEAFSLLRSARPKEAKSFAITALEHRPDSYERAALLAAIVFELGGYSEAERLAQQATTKRLLPSCSMKPSRSPPWQISQTPFPH